MLTLKVAETWPVCTVCNGCGMLLVCTVCNGWGMLLVCMGKTHLGGIIWGEVVMMHAQNFPISMYPPSPCISYALVQATVGVGTVLIWDLIYQTYQT